MLYFVRNRPKPSKHIENLNQMKKISVIIPTYNEAENIGRLLSYLQKIRTANVLEIIVIDGNSTDETIRIAKSTGVEVHLSPRKGRAAQMNYGAKLAKGNVFHFIHADTFPPESCFEDVLAAFAAGYPLGCFTYRFDSDSFLLKINGYFTRFDKRWTRGGDQTLFIERSVFEELKGFRDDFLIMEDFEFIERARAQFLFKIIKKDALVSARKYENNGYFRVQIANLVAMTMYRKNYSQAAIAAKYKAMLK